VAPNPLVGAVLVHDGRIVSEGFHQRYGGKHAEVIALEPVQDEALLQQSILYVNLEPCSHHGKTPPCAALIIEKKIPRVVIGAGDPNEKVNGRGIEMLRKAGVEVITGVEEAACRELNRRFYTYHERKRPYIILKWAQSQDGYMDSRRNKHIDRPAKITGAQTDVLTHRWRSLEQVIVVGARTVVMDNPSLTVRHVQGANPVRIVLDPDRMLTGDYRIFSDDAPTLVLGYGAPMPHVAYIAPQADILQQVCSICMQREWNSLYVEGGSYTLQSFLDAGLWDEIRVITHPALYLHEGIKAPAVPANTMLTESFPMEQDLVQTFRRAHYS
jgi:diaminohydroxyphosphoribosylaminopyrimidine deaminase/5-amino-6-(5-phosphoribosylamino)uracil reductase